MSVRILVAYSSKHGSTGGIADAIGSALRERGMDATVRRVADAGDPAAYDAVVLGSAVYVGGWRKDAARYLERHQSELRGMPTWLFSSGPTGAGDPAATLDGWTFPEALQPTLDVVRPNGVRLFHGALRPETLGVIERLVVRGIGAELGDFRDFEEIRAWANGIADALESPMPDEARASPAPAA